MTLTDARSKTATAIKTRLGTAYPQTRVIEYAGVFTTEEIKKFYTVTPAFLVSALRSEKTDVRLAVYLLTKATDNDPLPLVDDLAAVMRGLPGEGRPVLQVSSQCLYDADAGRAGAILWVVVATWPHKAHGQLPQPENGPISDELAAIGAKAASVSAAPKVATNEAGISLLEVDDFLPQIHIRSSGGDFEPSESGSSKWADAQNQRWKRKIIGRIEIPITLDFLGRNEAEAEAMAVELLPLLPRTEESEGLHRRIEVRHFKGPEGRDGVATCQVVLRFSTQIGGPPAGVPTIRTPSVSP